MKQAYPDPLVPPISPTNITNEQAEIDRVQNAQKENHLTLQNTINERNRKK